VESGKEITSRPFFLWKKTLYVLTAKLFDHGGSADEKVVQTKRRLRHTTMPVTLPDLPSCQEERTAWHDVVGSTRKQREPQRELTMV
jgi:hypothetical protein